MQSLWKFRLYHFDKEHHPLHIAIPKDQVQEFFWSESSDDCIVCIKRENQSKINSFESGLFVHLHCISIDHSKLVDLGNVTENVLFPLGKDSETPTLLCTKLFLHHYDFDIHDTVSLEQVTVFPLGKVVLSANTSKAFSWLNSQKFMTALLLSVCESSVLCRKNDVLLSPISDILFKDDSFSGTSFFDTTVLDCEPLNQGLLTLKTEIIISHICNSSKAEITSTSSEPFTLSTCDSDDFVKIDKVSSEYEVPVQHSLENNYVLYSREDIDVTDWLKPCIMPQPFLTQTFCNKDTQDELNIVGVSSKTLSKINIKDKSWVLMYKLSASSDSGTSSCSAEVNNIAYDKSTSSCNNSILESKVQQANTETAGRLVQVCAVDKYQLNIDWDSRAVYMTPLLWFQLNRHPSQLLQENGKVIIKVSSTICEHILL